MAYMRKKGKIWYFTYSCKGIKHEVKGGMTKKECLDAYLEYIKKNDLKNAYKNPMNILLGELYMYWKEKELVDYKYNTKKSYISAFENRILPEYGNYKIKDINASEIYFWLKELKKTYSYSSIKQTLAAFSTLMYWSTVLVGIIPKNPILGIRLPNTLKEDRDITNKGKRIGRKSFFIFSPSNIETIFNRFTPEGKLYAPCSITYYTGMRVGECLGLTWDKIDLEERSIVVNCTAIEKDGNIEIQPFTKNIYSNRKIMFGEKLLNIFYLLLDIKEYRKKHVEGYEDTSFVCVDRKGRNIKFTNIVTFNIWCKKEFGGGSFHSFRHTHATTLVENGVELEYISKRLGHSSISTTANIYVNLTDERNAEMANKIDAFLE